MLATCAYFGPGALASSGPRSEVDLVRKLRLRREKVVEAGCGGAHSPSRPALQGRR